MLGVVADPAYVACVCDVPFTRQSSFQLLAVDVSHRRSTTYHCPSEMLGPLTKPEAAVALTRSLRVPPTFEAETYARSEVVPPNSAIAMSFPDGGIAENRTANLAT